MYRPPKAPEQGTAACTKGDPPSGQEDPKQSGEYPRPVRKEPPPSQPVTPIRSGRASYVTEYIWVFCVESESLESRILPLQAAAYFNQLFQKKSGRCRELVVVALGRHELAPLHRASVYFSISANLMTKNVGKGAQRAMRSSAMIAKKPQHPAASWDKYPQSPKAAADTLTFCRNAEPSQVTQPTNLKKLAGGRGGTKDTAILESTHI